MARKLRDRLARLRDSPPALTHNHPMHKVEKAPEKVCEALEPGWTAVDALVRKRTLLYPLDAQVPCSLNSRLRFLIPRSADILVSPTINRAERFRFFDLETTGLSGGAGTIAFLAAIGRFVRSEGGEDDNDFMLRVDQFLLLDYPGEGVFLELMLRSFFDDGEDICLVSYNGKTFDYQILRNRCLMNGIHPPVFHHLDILHAARVLWRRVLSSCSLVEVERSILGMDRGFDLPGSQAPEAWFSFLRSGNAQQLLEICEHNGKDILGLALLLLRLHRIVGDPLGAVKDRPMDAEALALRWLRVCKLAAAGAATDPDLGSLECQRDSLVELAMEQGSARVMLQVARKRGRERCWEESAVLFRRLVSQDRAFPAPIRLIALRSLAIILEWRKNDLPGALEMTEKALTTKGLPSRMVEDFEKRKKRLIKKLANGGIIKGE